MGIEWAEVVLQPSQRGTLTFLPGETVRGEVRALIGGSRPHKIRPPVVKLRGKARTEWKIGAGSTKMTFTETQRLLRRDLPMLKNIKDPYNVQPGRFELSFAFPLPNQRLPYSQKHRYGKVSYKCKVHLISHSFWSLNRRAQAEFQVSPHGDLSRDHRLKFPLTVEREARRPVFGRDPGSFRVTVPRQGFVAGDVIDVFLEAPDLTLQTLASTDAAVKLKAFVEFKADGMTNSEKQIVAEVRPGRSPADWRHVRLRVPRGAVTMYPSSSGCRVISVSHYVKVWDAHVPVTLGTVPPPRGSGA